MIKVMTTDQYRNIIAYVNFWGELFQPQSMVGDILDMAMKASLFEVSREEAIDQFWSYGWNWDNDNKTLTYED